MITHLSLFSGVGGLDLAAELAGCVTVGQCEWAEYPTKVLEKHWPDVPRWRDIRTLTKENFYERTGRRTVDIISGGFPCQPFSVAGKRRGKEDDRYLWPEMVRVIKELRPTWIIGENVAGIVRMALPDILSELEACGYRTRTFLVPACAVGARHRRYRVAIVGCAEPAGMENTDSIGCVEPENVYEQPGRTKLERTGENLANAESIRLQRERACREQISRTRPEAWKFEGSSNVCHATGEGLPDRAGQQMGGSGASEQKPERPDSDVPDTDNGAGLCGGTGNYRQLKKLEESGTITEEERRNMSQGNGGQLNPYWVEWLMGLPIGWTEI